MKSKQNALIAIDLAKRIKFLQKKIDKQWILVHILIKIHLFG